MNPISAQPSSLQSSRTSDVRAPQLPAQGEVAFDGVSGLPQFAYARATDASSEQTLAKEMFNHLQEHAELGAVVSLEASADGNTTLLVASRADAADGSKLAGKLEVIARLASSTSIKAASVAHPTAFMAAHTLDQAGLITSVRLPGEQTEATLTQALAEGEQPNQGEQLKALVDSLPKGKRVALLVGGPSAAGKSSLIKTIRQLAGDRKVVDFPGDMYFRDADDPELPKTTSGTPYWDDPHAMHFDEMSNAIASLIKDGHADIPVYDFGATRAGGWHQNHVISTGCRLDKVTPTEMGGDDILVIDSIHATNAQVISKLDGMGLAHASVYLDSVTAEDRLVRRLVRDFGERGRSAEQTLQDWDATTFPGEKAFVRPTITQLDPAHDLYMVNKFPKDQELDRARVDHKVALLDRYGLEPTYEALATPDDQLPAFAASEKSRFEALLASPGATEADKKAARLGLDLLARADGAKPQP